MQMPVGHKSAFLQEDQRLEYLPSEALHLGHRQTNRLSRIFLGKRLVPLRPIDEVLQRPLDVERHHERNVIVCVGGQEAQIEHRIYIGVFKRAQDVHEDGLWALGRRQFLEGGTVHRQL